MDRDFLIDLFSEFGAVDIRRMFSGFGVSADGINFAMALRGGLFFRADSESIPRFEAEGCAPFQYQTRAKIVTVNSYWQLPSRLYDDPDELAQWARAALEAARRAAVNKKPRAKKAEKQVMPSPTASKPRLAKAEATKAKAAKAKSKTASTQQHARKQTRKKQS